MPSTSSFLRTGAYEPLTIDLNGCFLCVDQRGGAWPATQLTSGASYTFNWHLTAPHSTTDLQVLHHQAGVGSERPTHPPRSTWTRS
ncbi:lytic polysaccharide monooxygenase [Kribbella sp. NPDC050241]|uniref:lytic polysaccharide monooxygenase n=1 Tax=Kribbella sp. NPDC050241 TaxID=3364115 RepID=UPI00379B735A